MIGIYRCVLFCKWHHNAALSYQLVLPDELRLFVQRSLNDDMSYFGIYGMLDSVHVQLCWLRMAAELENNNKTSWSHHLEFPCMDFLSLEHRGKSELFCVFAGHTPRPILSHTQSHTFIHPRCFRDLTA